MPALYSHTTRATGTVLTASIYNTDHQNHITNGIPAMLDDYSSNVTAMQTATDPGEVGTESLATSLAGELERLRFAIKEVKERINGASIAQWYVTVTGDLQVADGGTGSSTAAGARTNLGIVLDVTSGTLPVASGGTGASVASSARTNLGISLDVTASVLAVASGGTGANSAAGARTNLGITLNVGSAQLPVADGGTASSTAAGARSNLGILLDVTAATLPIASGGTGQTSATAAFNALSPSTTKGDIIVHDGTNDVRVAVGTNDNVVVADSAQTAGLKWGTHSRVFKSTSAKVATFNITNADKGVLFEATGTYSVTFDALSTFDSDFFCYVMNVGTGRLTINPNASEVIFVPGGNQTGQFSFDLPSDGTDAPFNVSGVLIYKGSDSQWHCINVLENHGSIHYIAGGVNFTVPHGVNVIWVTAQAGGGAGGGAASSGSTGGRGGTSGEGKVKQKYTVVPGTVYAVTIGAGGTGVSAGTGNAGGTTSLGALFSLTGGDGGTAGTVGVIGAVGSYSNPSQLNNATHGGNGGAGIFGGSGHGTSSGNNGDAAPANSGGGGGGAGGNGISNFSGGAGGSGFMIVEW